MYSGKSRLLTVVMNARVFSLGCQCVQHPARSAHAKRGRDADHGAEAVAVEAAVGLFNGAGRIGRGDGFFAEHAGDADFFVAGGTMLAAQAVA